MVVGTAVVEEHLVEVVVGTAVAVVVACLQMTAVTCKLLTRTSSTISYCPPLL